MGEEVTLVRAVDANGDEVLECERGPDGEYIWNPTPEAFAAYRKRDAINSFINVCRAIVNEAKCGNPDRLETVEKGIMCTGYRYQRDGRLGPVYSEEAKCAIAIHGHYYMYAVKRGGAMPEHCLHNVLTFGSVQGER